MGSGYSDVHSQYVALSSFSGFVWSPPTQRIDLAHVASLGRCGGCLS